MNCIDALDRAYGLESKCSGVNIKDRPVRYEILSTGGKILISYGFASVHSHIKYIIPIRGALKVPTLSSNIANERSGENGFTSRTFDRNFSHPKASSRYDLVISERNITILAHPDLRTVGVVADYFADRESGYIQSGARAFFKREWFFKGDPVLGMEVTFMPVIMVRKGVEARNIKVI